MALHQPLELSYVREPSPPTLLPYRVRICGRNARIPWHSTLGTYYDDAMLTLILAGKGFYRRGGSITEVREGWAGIVLPNPDTGLLMADPDDPYDHFYCRFSGILAMEASRRILEECGGGPFFPEPRWRELAEVFRQLVACRPADPSRLEDRLRPVDGMLAHLLALLDAPENIKEQGLSRYTLECYMEERLAEPVNLDRMARYFSVSKSHLCRTGKRLLGETLLAAWRRRKLVWAELLLRDPAISIREVAARTGYDDPLYFSKVFHRHLGRTPSACRIH